MTITTATPPPRTSARNTAIAVGVVLAVLIAVLATRGLAGDKAATSALLGRPAPAITGTSLRDGTQVNLSQYRGKWVIVNFFATWCPPCVKEHPELIQFSTDHAANAVVIAVVFNDDAASVKSFFAERGGDWPVVDSPRTVVDYGVAKAPETFIIDPNGVVVAKADGAVTAKSLAERITP